VPDAAPTLTAAAGTGPQASLLAEATAFRGLAAMECLETYAATSDGGGGAPPSPSPAAGQRAPSLTARAQSLAACLVTPAFEEEAPGAEVRAAVRRLATAAELEATLEYAAETAGAAGGRTVGAGGGSSSTASRLPSGRTAPALSGGGGGGRGGGSGSDPTPRAPFPTGTTRRARRAWATLAAEDGLPAEAVAALESVLAAAAATAAGSGRRPAPSPARKPPPRASPETIAAVAPVFGNVVPLLLPPHGACKHTLSYGGGGSLDDEDFEAAAAGGEALWCPLPDPGVVAPPPADWPEEADAWLGAAASGAAAAASPQVAFRA